MPKIVLPKNIAKLKAQLETANNLIDYFLVCGVSPSICKEKYFYDIKKSKILRKFNEKTKTINFIKISRI